MTEGKLTESDVSEIIDRLATGDETQQEIADDFDVAQSKISEINQAHVRGRQKGRQSAIDDALDFLGEDDTEEGDDDEYWCGFCESEDGEKVAVEYMAEECRNGHDLTGEWEGV